MKFLLKRLVVIFSIAFFISSCSKEISLETGAASGIALGTLTDSAGNCKNTFVNGIYYNNADLTDSNFVLVNTNFSGLGKYLIYSDTVNGMWFIDSGLVLTTGAKSIKLKGKGRPFASGTTDFKFYFGTSNCSFSLTVGGPNNGTSNTTYCPITPNGWIRYGLTPGFSLLGGGSLDTFRTTISAYNFSYSTILGSKTYYKYETTPTSDTLAFTGRNSNGEYYSLGTPEFDYFYIYDTTVNNIVYMYLKDNVPKDATWNSDQVRVGIRQNNGTIIYGDARLKFTITDINQTATYLGISMTDIIKVKREMQFLIPGDPTFTTLLVAEISYAKGIGLVEQRIYNPSTPTKIDQALIIKGFKGL